MGFFHNFRTKVTHEMKRMCPYSLSQDVHAEKHWDIPSTLHCKQFLQKQQEQIMKKNAQTKRREWRTLFAALT